MGAFEYSDVDNAASYALEEKVDAETIVGWRNQLKAIQRQFSRRKLRALRGKTYTALVEGPSKDIRSFGKRGSKAWRRRLTANCISRMSRWAMTLRGPAMPCVS